MKRFIAVLSGILVLPAFAEVAPIYYDEIIEYTDDMLTDEDVAETAVQPVTQQKNVTQRNTINRSTSASRAISSATTPGATRQNTTTRAMASSPRATSTSTARGTVSRTARANSVANRNATTSATKSRASVTARGATNTKTTTARVGTLDNAVMTGNRTITGSAAQQKTLLTDSGAPLYNANSSRVGMRSRTTPTARLSASVLSASTATTPVVTEEDVKSTTDNLTAITELTDYCKAQYAACMDNYCNVLDDNEGRCSCSKNLKNYAKTEAALAKATEDFQDVVQKIRYIGLTGPQIEALFAETEAELAMKSNSDSSQLKSSLDAIKRKVVDVSSPTASSTASLTNGLSLDLNGLLTADFSAGFDLNSFLGMNNNNTSSVSNQRGEQLFKTATNRCKATVLNSCVAQGIDANVITNSYDLEIDKQCIAYERALNDANTEMKNNVFNATNILQQARLLLTQNKNSYDLRGCVAAIDACMQDEYVCGSDYELCLDPTGKYLANGEIVKGGTPGVSGGQNKNTSNYTPSGNWTSGGMYDLYATWNYGDGLNAWGAGVSENVGGYIDDSLATWANLYTSMTDTTKTDNLALYLLQKIGYIDSDDKVHGMCASAMKQCQDYTFNVKKSTKKYIPDNEVVRQYLNNTLAKIKVQQDAILADYAEGCRTDVQTCLTTNGYDDTNPSSTSSATAVNACSADVATCMSVGGYHVNDGTKLTLRAMKDWVASMLVSCSVNKYLVDDGIGDGFVYGSSTQSGRAVSCIECPNVNVGTVSGNRFIPSSMTVKTISAGGRATTCECPEGYSSVYVISNTSATTTYTITNVASAQVPANLRCVSTNDASSCKNTEFWNTTLAMCQACPDGTTKDSAGTGCDCGSGVWNWYSKTCCAAGAYVSGSECTACPEGSTVNTSKTGCICNNASEYWSPTHNTCVSNSSTNTSECAVYGYTSSDPYPCDCDQYMETDSTGMIPAPINCKTCPSFSVPFIQDLGSGRYSGCVCAEPGKTWNSATNQCQ